MRKIHNLVKDFSVLSDEVRRSLVLVARYSFLLNGTDKKSTVINMHDSVRYLDGQYWVFRPNGALNTTIPDTRVHEMVNSHTLLQTYS